MHYHYFTIEQREALERLIRSSMAGRPEMTSALARLHSAEYGVCEACGGDIPYTKLTADPLQRRCARCLL
ncbi:MAG TPA: TraR/DksA C4-type zinc finger protein [Burkholderiales bacterium]|jgi:RNA polymerase-binding transcription factor DksA|nr:TraR/DksA C4-type zinc finger protein [Burkholderiales bacterium]